jgi:hypothetical protein
MQQIIWEMWCKTPPTVKQVAPSLFNWNPLPVTIPKDMPAVLQQLLKDCVSTVKSSRPTFSTIIDLLNQLKIEEIESINKQQAVKYYKMAADQGDADAQFNRGFRYGGGRGSSW